jgi:hypothetical protein
MNMAASQPNQLGNAPRSGGFYALIFGGVLVVAAVAAYGFTSGGLPGTHDSPSATVGGKTISGKTGSD